MDAFAYPSQLLVWSVGWRIAITCCTTGVGSRVEPLFVTFSVSFVLSLEHVIDCVVGLDRGAGSPQVGRLLGANMLLDFDMLVLQRDPMKPHAVRVQQRGATLRSRRRSQQSSSGGLRDALRAEMVACGAPMVNACGAGRSYISSCLTVAWCADAWQPTRMEKQTSWKSMI